MRIVSKQGWKLGRDGSKRRDKWRGRLDSQRKEVQTWRNQGTDKDTGVQRQEGKKGQKSDTVRWIERFQRLRQGDKTARRDRVGGKTLLGKRI